MAYRKNAKNLQAEVDSDVKSDLKRQVGSRKQVQNDAVTGALRVWLSLPIEIQAKVLSSPPKDMYEYLTKALLDAETLKLLAQLSLQERRDLFEKARKTAAKASRKK